jgi:hypothetical protein
MKSFKNGLCSRWKYDCKKKMQKSNTNQIKHDTYLLKMSTLHFQDNNYGEQTHSATISFRVSSGHKIRQRERRVWASASLCVWVSWARCTSEKDLFGTLSNVRGAQSRIIKGISKLALTSQREQLPFCCAQEFSRSVQRQKQEMHWRRARSREVKLPRAAQKLSRVRTAREQKKPKLCHGKGELIYVSINCTLDASEALRW